MSRFFRALFVSAVATGAAALVLNQLQKHNDAPAPKADRPGQTPGFTAAQEQALLDELAGQLEL